MKRTLFQIIKHLRAYNKHIWSSERWPWADRIAKGTRRSCYLKLGEEGLVPGFFFFLNFKRNLMFIILFINYSVYTSVDVSLVVLVITKAHFLVDS